MNAEIIIVSGLPRSGTSVMMQMLDHGGIEVVTDHVRTADTDNPKGYYELEKVKKIKTDSTWLPATRGKAFKMVSQLLYDLPMTEKYCVVFMERNLEEVLQSQEKMLRRLNKPVAPVDDLRQAFALHLQRLHEWLKQQRNFKTLCVNYNDLIEQPESQSERIREFLPIKPNVKGMVSAVDTSLYRNRKSSGDRHMSESSALGNSK